jgi:hypothetical protein
MGGRGYYLFLGFHGFLLGLFPFFLPVYLYKSGSSLSLVSFFAGVTGLGFVLSLWGWDRLRPIGLHQMIVLSLLLELLLVLAVFMHAAPVVTALINGFYSCFYWMIQRVLFLAPGTADNSGRRFGNFQVFVAVVLKAGIFTGSLLLEDFGLPVVCLFSLVVVILALLIFQVQKEHIVFPGFLKEEKPLGMHDIRVFRDRIYSRSIFLIDGIFLYLESYFWLVSLFLIVGESFVKLGGMVILLALFPALIFLLIKERIDRLDSKMVYTSAVFLYAFSWGLRGFLTGKSTSLQQAGIIILVAFCTSFFRLALNKRFFDYARISGGYRYLFLKSFYSQFSLAFFFLLLSFFLRGFQGGAAVLPVLYWCASLISLGYLLYGTKIRLSGG